MSGLPTGWLTAFLGDLHVEARSGFPSGRHNSAARGVPHLRPMNISRGGDIDLDVVKYVESPRDQRVRDGDVLFNNTNSPDLVGKTAYFGRQGDWAFSNHMTRLRPPAGLDARFLAIQLHYLWRCGAFSRLCSNHVNQASVSSKTLLWAVRIVVPPTAEQERIVASIEAQFSRLDSGIAALGIVRQNLMRIRTAVLTQAVQGWPEAPLGDIGEVFVGSTPSRSRQAFWGGNIPWVSSGEVAFGRIRETRETITEAGLGRAARLHPSGTVLLAMIGEGKTRGQAAILDVAAAHNQNSAAIRLEKNRCLPEWLFYVLMARYEETRRASSGGNQPALNSRRVRAIPIPLPALDQQRRIVSEIERRLSLIDGLSAEADRIVHRGEALRVAILHRAFAGKLVRQDAGDEPASILLGRIGAERESSNGHNPAKARAQRRKRVAA